MDTRAATTAESGGVAKVIGQIQAERQRFSVMRLSFVLVCIPYALLAVWAVPWIPFGMMTADYSGNVAVLLVLAATGLITSLIFVAVWVHQFRHDTVPEFLRVLFGAKQLIRGRQQFESRLTVECQRARSDRRRLFSLIVIKPRISASEGGEPRLERQLAALVVRSTVRGDDVVADCRAEGVWVLSLGAGHEARRGIVNRLACALTDPEAQIPSPEAYRIGSSTYDADGHDSNQLLAAAQQRLMPLTDLIEGAFAA